jgi:hypothetical protein
VAIASAKLSRYAVAPCSACRRYSPEPDRQFLSKRKALLRKAATRSIDSLWEVIGSCPADFSPSKYAAYLTLPDTVAGMVNVIAKCSRVRIRTLA